MKVEKISLNNNLLAVVVRDGSNSEELLFPTPEDFPLQLGIHDRKKKTFLKRHNHLLFEEIKNLQVQEFIYIERGKLEFVLYHNKEEVKRVVLKTKDMILLNCGHSVEFLEDSKIIEIKQGPYRGNEGEKEYF
jgi:hypothetical protein